MSIPRTTIEATLTGGLAIKLRTPTTKDDLNAMAEAAEIASGDFAVRNAYLWALVKRSCVSIGGEEFDQSSDTSLSFKDRFDGQQWMEVLHLFDAMHEVSQPGEEFRSSIRRGSEA